MAKDDKKRLVEGPGLLGSMVHNHIDRNRLARQKAEADQKVQYANSEQGSAELNQLALDRWVKKLSTDWVGYAKRNDLQPTTQSLQDFISHTYPWFNQGNYTPSRSNPTTPMDTPKAVNDVAPPAPRANNQNLRGAQPAAANTNNSLGAPQRTAQPSAANANTAGAPVGRAAPAPAPANDAQQAAAAPTVPQSAQPTPAPEPAAAPAPAAPPASPPAAPAPAAAPAEPEPAAAPVPEAPANANTSQQKHDDAMAKLDAGEELSNDEYQHISDHINRPKTNESKEFDESVIDEDKIGQIRYANDLAVSIDNRSYKDRSLLDTIKDLGLYDEPASKPKRPLGRAKLKEAPAAPRAAPAAPAPPVPPAPPTPPAAAAPPGGGGGPPGVKSSYTRPPPPDDPNGPLNQNDIKRYFTDIARHILNSSPARLEAAKHYDVGTPEYDKYVQHLGGNRQAGGQSRQQSQQAPQADLKAPQDSGWNKAVRSMENIFDKSSISIKDQQSLYSLMSQGNFDSNSLKSLNNDELVRRMFVSLLNHEKFIPQKPNK